MPAYEKAHKENLEPWCNMLTTPNFMNTLKQIAYKLTMP